MTQQAQAEALLLAEILDSGRWVNYGHREKAATELRRLHARVQELEAVQMPVPDAYLYVNGAHRGVSLEWRSDSDLAEGTERHDLHTGQQVRAMVAAQAAPGWKLVPIEPTASMVEAAEEAHMPFGDMHIAIQMALAAAPTLPAQERKLRVSDPACDYMAWEGEVCNKCRRVHRIGVETK